MFLPMQLLWLSDFILLVAECVTLPVLELSVGSPVEEG
jgi:hypothetical protein